MKVHELISELEKNPELEFGNEIEAAFKLGEISERNRILNGLNELKSYTPIDWHRTIDVVIYDLKTIKI